MPDPASESVTLVQILTWVGTFVGGAIAAFFGVRVKQRRNGNGDREDYPGRSVVRGVQWWDTPSGKVLETLQEVLRVLTDILREQTEARVDHRRFADERNKKLDDQTNILREIEVNTRDFRLGRPARRE